MKSTRSTTYTCQRVVRYSDCDASRNYYTPWAIGYAVEALEGWFETVLGVSWPELIRQRDCEVDFAHIGCEFRKTLTAGELVRLSVEIAGLGNTHIRFGVTGNNGYGETCFQATLLACFTALQQGNPLQIPPEYRLRIENYHGVCAEVTDPVCESSDTQILPRSLGSTVPFILQRRVVYGDCGMSGTIHAPRVFDFLLEAVGDWYEKFLGISWLEQNSRKRGQPFLIVSCDFLKPMSTGEIISTTVIVSRLGRSSIGYSVAGCDGNGVHCFEAQLTACYSMEEAGALKAVPFPDELREKIIAYQQACGGSIKTSGENGASGGLNAIRSPEAVNHGKI